MNWDFIRTRIGELCAANELSVKEMCKRANVKYTTIQSFQWGDSKTTSLTNIEAIARYFQVKIEYLTQEQEMVVDNGEISAFVPLAPKERAFITAYRMLPDDLRSSLSRFVEDAAKTANAASLDH